MFGLRFKLPATSLLPVGTPLYWCDPKIGLRKASIAAYRDAYVSPYGNGSLEPAYMLKQPYDPYETKLFILISSVGTTHFTCPKEAMQHAREAKALKRLPKGKK